MFTGIIEKVLPIKKITINKGKIFTIETKDFNYIKDIIIGDSIAINGVCQTVTNINNKEFSFYAAQETLNITNLKEINCNTNVNVEKSMTYNSRINGHLLSGHIDKKVKIISIKKKESSIIFRFNLPKENNNLVILKGSIAINGISLTVYDIKKNWFEVMIIPHTYNHTNLKYLKINELVNIEYDSIGKYLNTYLNKYLNNIK